MKRLLLLYCFFLCCYTSYGQYYLRGQVKDDKGRPLMGAKIIIKSKSLFQFFSGSDGSFGIPTSLALDSIYCSLEGFESAALAVNPNQFQNIALKMLSETMALMKSKLVSRTKNLLSNQDTYGSGFGESYSSLIENDFVNPTMFPETGYSLSTDRASYSNIRRFLNNGLRAPADAVRVEEMLNYFNFSDTNFVSSSKDKFSYNTKITSCPWNPENRLLFINSYAPKINLDSVPPCNLVFLIDVSGSMERPNRLPLLQSAFKLLVENLREKDSVAIVSYGGGVNVELFPINGGKKDTVKDVIDSLFATGETPGENAIRTAYSLAKSAFIKNGNNRVILATDGDFNVGQTSEQDLEDLIVLQKKSGIYLTCLGVGMGNFKDSKLEALAKKGNGNYAYLDNIQEAEKVLVQEFTKTIYAVAKDAFVNIKFNPNYVQQYRLIGYDNKKDALTDSTSVLSGGEVGSGHNSMAIFEIKPTTNLWDNTEWLADINLEYKEPKTDSVNTNKKVICNVNPVTIDSAAKNYRLASAISMFGHILKGSKYIGKLNFEDLVNYTRPIISPNKNIEQELLELMSKAENIYEGDKKKKKKRNKKDKGNKEKDTLKI